MRIIYHHRTRATDAQRIHILEIVNAFRELGHEVEIVSLVDTEAKLDEASRDAGDGFIRGVLRRIPFLYDAVQLAYNLAGLPLLLWKTCRNHPDFIYERYSLFNFAGIIVSRFCRIPLLLEVNSPFALEQQRDRDIRAVGLAAWSERVILNGAFRVVVVSTPLRRILVEAGIHASKIVMMSNGVRTGHPKQSRDSAALRRELGLDGRTAIGFIGWFRKWHGLEMLLEAFRDGGLADLGAAVVLMGDGPAMSDLRDFVALNDLSRDVIFTGPLPHDRVRRYLDVIDIAVQPAANEYCCPMKIFEYMAAAKPIVAPRQENIAEILAEGADALLFTPGDPASLASALEELIRKPDLARALGQCARAAIDERGYLWRRNADRVINLIQDQPVTLNSESAKGSVQQLR